LICPIIGTQYGTLSLCIQEESNQFFVVRSTSANSDEDWFMWMSTYDRIDCPNLLRPDPYFNVDEMLYAIMDCWPEDTLATIDLPMPEEVTPPAPHLLSLLS
jgi:hypothetical protein